MSAPERGSRGVDEGQPGLDRGGGARVLGPTRRSLSALPIEALGAGMLVRGVRVRAPDVVFVKGLVEASDGLAAVFSERGGELTLVASRDRGAELAELLADLERDLGACVDGAGSR